MEYKFTLFGVSPSIQSWEKIKQQLDILAHDGKKIGLDISNTQLDKLKNEPLPTQMDYVGNPKLALAKQLINYAKSRKLVIIPLKTVRADMRKFSEEQEWLTSRKLERPDNQATEYLIESGMRMRVKKFKPDFVIVHAARMGAFRGIPHRIGIDERGVLEKYLPNTIEKMRRRQIIRRARNIKKIRKKQQPKRH